MNKKISLLLSAAVFAASLGTAALPVGAEGASGTFKITYNYGGADHTRRMEPLDRGLVAVKTEDGVFLSWRLSGDEASVRDILKAPDFDVYRDGEMIAAVTDSTNYLDRDGTADSSYTVAVAGTEEQCSPVDVWNKNYIEIPLEKPQDSPADPAGNVHSHTASDISCGDVDGDGQYELIMEWSSDPQDAGANAHSYTGNVVFDAYELTGERLWRLDLGHNVVSGEHEVQFIVYDLNGDGRSELICCTAPGSKDAGGNYVTEASLDSGIKAADNTADYRNSDGRIFTGPEYMTVFDGATGIALDTIDLPIERVDAGTFGDDFGNRCNRFLADVAYLDGVNPYAVFWRGYYGGQNGRAGRTTVCGVTFDGERLNAKYRFDTLSSQPGYTDGNEKYYGQGNHNITSADVDDDGRDELITGGICIEADDTDDLKVKWCSMRGHGDALHIGDYDPINPGLEYFSVHESGGYTATMPDGTLKTMDYGMTVYRAEDGTELFHAGASRDTGRGVMANVGSGGYYQISSAAGTYASYGGTDFRSVDAGGGSNFRIFWDGDLYDEVLDGINISSWNGSRMENVFQASGCVAVNGTKNVPNLQADLFGDWREEVIWATSDNTALRVYTTTDITEYKLPTLMHDPVYRNGVAAEQTAYNQPPHIGFYLAEEVFKPAVDSIEITNYPAKRDYFVGDQLDAAGLVVTAVYSDGSSETVDGYILSGYNPNVAGEQTITVTYAQKTTEFTVNVDPGFTINDDGYVTGCTLTKESAVLPEIIDGITVRGIADSALKDSTLKEIIVLFDECDIGSDVFPEDITVRCHISSDVYAYAKANGIRTELIDSREYSVNNDFSEQSYDSWSMVMGRTAQQYTVGHITYGVGGRSRGGDGQSGFMQTEYEGDKVLRAAVGRFYTSNRHAYFSLTDTPKLSDMVDTVFETDFMLCSGEYSAKIEIRDSNGEVIDTISENELGVQKDKWYTYKLICHKGKLYRSVAERGGAGQTEIIGTTASEYGASDFRILADGNAPGNTQSAGIYLDNLKVYTNNEIADLSLTVTDEKGIPVSGADVTLDGAQYKADAAGRYSNELFAGLYTVTVSAPGYEPQTISVNAYRGDTVHTAVLKKESTELIGLEFEKKTIALKTGQTGHVRAYTIPENVSEQGIIYSSSDTAVVTVDDSGAVMATGTGSAVIMASSAADESIKAECAVTVYDDYESQLTSIEVTGDDILYIPAVGSVKSAPYSAVGYDQNGIATDAYITWSADGLIVSAGGAVTVSAGTKPGEYTITAQSGTVTGTKTVTAAVIDSGADMIAEEKCEAEMKLVMGTSAAEQTVGDITYGIGGRGGGDGSSGVKIENDGGENVLKLLAGKFSNSGREPYMQFDKAPAACVPGTDYVIETDIRFNDLTNSVELRDASDSVIMQFTGAQLGVKTGIWNHLMIICTDGAYSVYVNDGGTLRRISLAAASRQPVSSMHFPKGDIDYAVVSLRGFKYFSAGGFLKDIYVRAENENGEPIKYADVNIAGISNTASELGSFMITLPLGVYGAEVTADGENLGTALVNVMKDTGVVTVVPKKEIIPPAPAKKTSTAYDNGVLTITDANKLSGIVIAAFYDENGVMKAVKTEKTNSSGVYTIANDAPEAAEARITVWNSLRGLRPLTDEVETVILK